MKKRKLLLTAALALVIALSAWILLSDNVCIAPIEERSDGQWSLLHVYMTGEREIGLPVTKDGQLCVFAWQTGRGSFSGEITNAAGDVVFSTEGGKTGKETFPAASDLTLHLSTKGHGGYFSLTLEDDPEYEEPGLLVSGTHTEGMLHVTFSCQKDQGEYLNFYVENLGTDAVIIRINGMYDRIIPAGSGGHITAPVEGEDEAQDMIVTCISTGNDDININWKVAQHHG